ncbi:MAG: pilus assembly protein PilM, partial [Actinomycetota bacterium]|nr:pilus assembly protein PilM [Actinomycetota bacterium]
AGLRPAMVDLTSFAVLRAQAHRESGVLAPTAEVLVDVGASVTNVVVHQGGVPRFVRILLMGGGDITDALVQRFGVPPEQAEEVKQRTGLAPVPGAPASSPMQRALEMTGSGFVEEVRGSLGYYAAQSGSARIDRIVLSGGGSRLSGLAERLSAATRLPVDTARPLETLTLGRTGLTPEQLVAAEPTVTVPVGLALGMAA